MNKNLNAGLAPLAVVLIILGVAVVGGGVYVAVKSSSDTSVAQQATVVPSTSVAMSATPTAKPVATKTAAPKTATPIPTQKPLGVSVTFATFGDAVNSGKSIYCTGTWGGSGKGSSTSTTKYRNVYTINGPSITIASQQQVNGVVSNTGDSLTLTPSSSSYATYLTYSLASATCTQK
jgi:hypothetical protein